VLRFMVPRRWYKKREEMSLIVFNADIGVVKGINVRR
jgi:hypothetical protein